ncbi:hypothetical protein [Halomonas rhizosphaerae]|uniref:Uncharacterized protein n=1 Tax=Halomonas rhizosphaerae TaxID=3043296 RepID=A0ABT6UZX6_9GAMM|nr:hypothetical protein [Halomonas rhizosphaerae]MDI5891504.1 hypothetical protein [Halomonas rhizosphaerae]MDI5919817.1 hypothetical protein [Halomonas rhizosphaerae]
MTINTGHHRWTRFLACLLAAALAVSPLATAQDWTGQRLPTIPDDSSSQDDVSPDDIIPQDEPDTTRDSGGGGGSDWTVPAIVAGTAATVLLVRWLRERRQAAKRPTADERDKQVNLQQQGPEFAPIYNTSAFAAIGLVQGNWPFVLDFAHDEPVIVTLRISARGVPDIYTLRFPFGAYETGHHRLQFQLPPAFGDSERPAAIAVTATDSSGKQTAPSFRVLALGCGPRAVGSVAIEEVTFLPRLIRAQAREQASYRFFSRSDFPSVMADFMRVEPAEDGERHFFVDEEPIDGGVSAGRSIEPQQWDGRDAGQRISAGTHRLKIRAWAPTRGWLTVWSDSRVDVSP